MSNRQHRKNKTKSFIHPTARLSPHVTMGKRVQIGKHSKLLGIIRLGEKVRIGKNITLMGVCIIGNNVSIGDNSVLIDTHLGNFVSAKKVILSEDVWIHNHVTLGKDVVIEPYCTIEEHTTIGDNVTVRSWTKIGHHTQIGNDVIVGQTGGGPITPLTGMSRYNTIIPPNSHLEIERQSKNERS